MAEDLDTSEGLVRIRIRLEGAGESAPAEDSVWAEPLGSERYRVESCPFFAYGISRDDVVRAAEAAGEGGPVLDDVLEKGGHRTLRLTLGPSVELRSAPVQRILEKLIDLGCTHELLRPRLVAIDLPPEVELELAAGLLQDAARAGSLAWEWADPRPS
jgi:hypothetical protein